MAGDVPAFDWREQPTREALASALAETVAERLQQAVSARGTATLAVSGGSTPARFFDVLSNRAIAWKKVTVTLVDERFVPESSPRSNAALVAAHLLRNAAAEARFVPLYSQAAGVESAAAAADARLRALSWPLDVVVLGMGGDGHTASFFPDAPALASLLDKTNSACVLPVHAASAGEPRLTLSLPRLVEAALVVLHIEGGEKRRVFDAAVKGSSALPIRAVLDAAPKPIEVYWAP